MDSVGSNKSSRIKSKRLDAATPTTGSVDQFLVRIRPAICKVHNEIMCPKIESLQSLKGRVPGSVTNDLLRAISSTTIAFWGDKTR